MDSNERLLRWYRIYYRGLTIAISVLGRSLGEVRLWRPALSVIGSATQMPQRPLPEPCLWFWR